MQNKFLRLLTFLAPLFVTVLVAAPAMALVEVSVGYAGIASSGGGGNWAVPNASYSGAYGLTADLRFNLPFSSFNFGARYSQLGLNTSQNGQTLAMQNNSTSALVGYRFIDTFLLFGPVFTYGIINNGTLENTLSSTGSNTATAGSVSQYTAGLEIGIKFPILVAAEVGYGSLNMSNFNNSQTYPAVSGSPTSVQLGGLYARASVGLSF